MFLDIGKRIKYRRKELQLTQLQIKEAVGISSGNLSDIENGNKLPSTPTLLSLAQVLSCSIDWLLKGEDCSGCSLCDEKEKKLLESFRKLTPYDQDEIMDIITIKQKRAQKEQICKKSSHLAAHRDDKQMA